MGEFIANVWMTFIQTVKQSCDFRSRASRQQFCWFVIASLILALVLVALAWLVPSRFKMPASFLLTAVMVIFIVIPFITLAIRRAHDLDRSAWLVAELLLGWLLVLSPFYVPKIMELVTNFYSNIFMLYLFKAYSMSLSTLDYEVLALLAVVSLGVLLLFFYLLKKLLLPMVSLFAVDGKTEDNGYGPPPAF